MCAYARQARGGIICLHVCACVVLSACLTHVSNWNNFSGTEVFQVSETNVSLYQRHLDLRGACAPLI